MASKVKMYPGIKSRILPGFKYPADYPRGLKGHVDTPTLTNSDLPATMLNTPITLENLARKTLPSMKGAFYLGTLPGIPNTGDDAGYYSGKGPVAGASSTPTKWIIRKVSGGYTIELANPTSGGKYLSSPGVCYTPLQNPEAALKDQPWPIGKIVNGKVVPHKYAVQGPEWTPAVGGLKNPQATAQFNGMFGTPGWYPVVMIGASPTVWKINISTKYYNSKGLGGGPYLSFQPVNSPPKCPSILKFFPPRTDEYYKVATLGSDMNSALTAWKVGVTATEKPSSLAPGETAAPVATSSPFEMSAAPAYGGVSTRVNAGNVDLGLNIANASANTNNIANQGGGGGGDGGGDATNSLLLASLLAQQQPPAETAETPVVYPYPNPYAVPPPYDAGLTATPVPPPETTLSPSEIALQQLMASMAPTVAPVVPWYSSPAAIAGGVVLFLAAAFGVWWFLIKKKKSSPSANTGSGSYSGNYYSLGNVNEGAGNAAGGNRSNAQNLPRSR